MTNEEIVRHYNEAANKPKDIKILADLNCTSQIEIRAILASAGVAGVEMPKRVRQKTAACQEPDSAPFREETQAAALPPIYSQIEAILAALPERLKKEAADQTQNLLMTLFADYLGRKFRRKVPSEPG